MGIDPWDCLAKIQLLRAEKEIPLPGAPLRRLFEQAMVEMSNKAYFLKCATDVLGIDTPAMLAKLIDRFEPHAFDAYFRSQNLVLPVQSQIADLKPRLAQQPVQPSPILWLVQWKRSSGDVQHVRTATFCNKLHILQAQAV